MLVAAGGRERTTEEWEVMLRAGSFELRAITPGRGSDLIEARSDLAPRATGSGAAPTRGLMSEDRTVLFKSASDPLFVFDSPHWIFRSIYEGRQMH
jgi:hypothetical protein